MNEKFHMFAHFYCTMQENDGKSIKVLNTYEKPICDELIYYSKKLSTNKGIYIKII